MRLDIGVIIEVLRWLLALLRNEEFKQLLKDIARALQELVADLKAETEEANEGAP